ncbi:MAG: peptidylprolyl isomerase [Bacilli bacterium]
MKKSKKGLVVTLALVGLLSLAGCNQVTSNSNVMLSFEDSNGEVKYYTADDLFNKYTQNTSSSDSSYYTAVYNVMVRSYFNESAQEALKSEADKAAAVSVEGQKKTASTNADTNGTSYDEEFEKILDTELSDIAKTKRSESELLLKYQLTEYKSRLEDKFYDTFKKWDADTSDTTSDEYKFNLFSGKDGYLNKRLPYHVKHILVNVDATEGEYTSGTISSANVQSLYNTITDLANGVSFGEVAEDRSDDSGSASIFGDLGIMENSTSYVNEFKLGVYAYDTYFNTGSEVNKSLSTDSNPFSVPEDDEAEIKKLGIAEIPYGAIAYMYTKKDTTKATSGAVVNDGNESFYPRNIMFNKYFNNHNLAFITPNSLISDTENYPTQVNAGDTLNEHWSDLDENGKWTTATTTYPGTESMSGFQNITIKKYNSDGTSNGTTTKKVLCDDKGNPILVVRAGTSSYQGVHFIVVERSALEQEKTYTDSLGNDYTSTLKEYYASENPLTSSGSKNSNFPTDSSNEQKKTYVNAYSMGYSDYNDRVSKLKSAVKSFDTNYEMRIYSWLEDQLDISYNTVNSVNLGDKIHNYINLTRENTDYSTRKSDTETWDTFIEQLDRQQEARKTQLISETCALHFENGYSDSGDIVKGACYREKTK